jgi:hypothetical protein
MRPPEQNENSRRKRTRGIEDKAKNLSGATGPSEHSKRSTWTWCQNSVQGKIHKKTLAVAPTSKLLVAVQTPKKYRYSGEGQLRMSGK